MSDRDTAAARWSLSRHLVRSLTLGLAGLWLCAVISSVVVVRHELNEVFDGALQEAALRLLPLALDDLQEAEEHDGAREVADTGDGDDTEAALAYQVRELSGRILIRSHDAPRVSFPDVLATGYSESDGWRSYTVRAVDRPLYIQVAEPMRHRDEALLEVLVWLIAPVAFLAPLAGMIVMVAIRRVLTPIAGVREAIRTRGRSDLAPIDDGGLPDELAPIVDDVNRLLRRLGHALESERSFAANSAHELRTPVAAALAQLSRLATELQGTAAAERAERIATVLRGLAGRIEKLLQLARADAGIALRREPVDPVQVVELLVEEFRRQEQHADRLHLEIATEDDVRVETDIDALAIALRNLIENALVHGTPDGIVQVTVADDRSIRVINDGPAVVPERLAALTGRFERGGGPTPGTGLGLAIADTIIRQAGGSLQLLSPATGRADGFEAVVRFPADG